ncbi:MAG: efflux transporter outer membrane subunit, partial [Methylocystaceae bacterium]|nr:efflux transporter outer membrane subunit [Methylocystaceae bacterium]
MFSQLEKNLSTSFQSQALSLRSRAFAQFYVFISLAFTLSACAVGPNFVAPEPPDVERFTKEDLKSIETAKGSLALNIGRDVPERWWETFHNKKLNRIIINAINHNQTLEAAEASIRVAYFNAEAQKGFFLPQISLSPGGSANLDSNKFANIVLNQKLLTQSYPNPASVLTNIAVPSTTAVPPPWSYRLITPAANLAYTPDVWGKIRRTVEALEAQQDIARYQLEAAYLTMTSNVALTAIMEASLRSQYEAIERVIAIEHEALEMMRTQLKVGWASEADVLAQEALYAQAKQLLPPIQKQIALARNLLTALEGEYSTAQSSDVFKLSELRLPKNVPVSLPSKFVRQRPDVRAAEANMHMAAAQIGIAIGARLPEFNLSGAGGASAYHFEYVFMQGTQFYNILGNATTPIFQGFTLLNQQKAAEANFDEAAALYRSTVVQAFQDVADMLRSLQADSESVKAAIYSEEVAHRQLEILRAELKIGSVSVLMLLNAQNNYMMATVSRIQAEGNQLADVAGLFMALGGGWSDQVLKKL